MNRILVFDFLKQEAVYNKVTTAPTIEEAELEHKGLPQNGQPRDESTGLGDTETTKSGILFYDDVDWFTFYGPDAKVGVLEKRLTALRFPTWQKAIDFIRKF